MLRPTPCLRALLVALSSLACRQVIGDYEVASDRGPGDTPIFPGTCAPLQYESSACQRCMDAECCGELSVCAGDPGCSGLLSCEVACRGGDLGCRSECVERYYGSTRTSLERAAVAQCRKAACAEACGEGCGIPSYATDCEACIEQACCTESAALAGSPEVAAFAACRLQGNMAPCEAPAGGEEALQAFTQCKGRCATRCATQQAPPDWSCLGSVVWPSPPATRTSVRADVLVGLTSVSVPLAGIEVAVCQGGGLGCFESAPPGVTGPDGRVTVTPSVRNVLGGAFHLQFHDPAGRVDDLKWFRFPPPVHDPVAWVGLLYPPGLMHSLAVSLGSHFDLRASHVHVFLQSCGGLSAEGVVLSSPDAPPGVVVFYGDDIGLPVAGKERTDRTSNGGFLNVDASRRLTIEAHIEATGQLIARVPVSLVPSGMTIVNLAPSPDAEALVQAPTP